VNRWPVLAAITVASLVLGACSSDEKPPKANSPRIPTSIRAELLPDRSPAVYEMLAQGTAVPASEVFQETLKAGELGSSVDGDAYGLAFVQSQTYPVITTNGGKSWTVDGPIFYIAAADAPAVVDQIANVLPNTVFVWGEAGHVVVSTDGGEHWWSSNFNGALSMGQSWPGNGLFVVMSINPSVTYTSSDGGRTWSLDKSVTKVRQ
jgi:hypothetical protein